MSDVSTIQFEFDNTYANQLEGFYVNWEADTAPNPEILCFNSSLAKELGIIEAKIERDTLAQIFSGNEAPVGSHPLAQVYAGHQFGGFSPQLGDGRALLIGEVIDTLGIRKDIQLKGSGSTPFSRGGDGKAGIGPVLREYLMAEAMHAMGIPTTRALAAVKTGENIWRDRPVAGAILTRIASSHIRVGTFQFFASRGETEKLRQLADYCIARHYPELQKSETSYLDLLNAVIDKQAKLIAQWMSIGFIHGVMNTDNMTVSGETIDYGPCAFMDGYDPKTVFSSIDEQGRYAYGNQPTLGQWNLARFAECVIVLIDEDKDKSVELATQAINAFPSIFEKHWTALMCQKLGLGQPCDGDMELAHEFLKTMEGQTVDFTLAFRHLSHAVFGDEKPLADLYQATTLLGPWIEKWRNRIALDDSQSDENRANSMNTVNPLYIPRNHKVEEALKAAEAGDMQPFEKLQKILISPFERTDGNQAYEEPDPMGGKNFQTFCGT